MEMSTLIELPDGRKIEVRTAGPKEGQIVLFHHGTPGAGLPFSLMALAAAAKGLRMVMYSRPGYGLSTPDPGRKVIDAASDTAAVMDALGAKTFRTIGWSGGGPHALACAVALQDRCLSTLTISSFAPYPADGIDWFSGMADENVAEYQLALQGNAALTPFIEASADAVANMQPSGLIAAMGGLISDVDRAQLTGEFGVWMANSLRIGFSHGIAGSLDDDLAFMRDWGFRVTDTRSVVVWHGSQDRIVPYAHGLWLADHIPAARRRLFAHEGHLSIVRLFDQMFDDLMIVS